MPTGTTKKRRVSQKPAETQAVVADTEIVEKAAPPSTAVSASDNAPPANLLPGAAVTDLRAGNAAQTQANIRALLTSGWAEEAALFWDQDSITYEQLPDTLKTDWIAEYCDNHRNNEGQLNEEALTAAEAAIGRDYYQLESAVEVPKVGTAPAPAAPPGDA